MGAIVQFQSPPPPSRTSSAVSNNSSTAEDMMGAIFQLASPFEAFATLAMTSSRDSGGTGGGRRSPSPERKPARAATSPPPSPKFDMDTRQRALALLTRSGTGSTRGASADRQSQPSSPSSLLAPTAADRDKHREDHYRRPKMPPRQELEQRRAITNSSPSRQTLLSASKTNGGLIYTRSPFRGSPRRGARGRGQQGGTESLLHATNSSFAADEQTVSAYGCVCI